MASSGNFCTLSPLDRSEYGTASSLTGGNLRYQTTGSGPGNNDATRGTMATPTTGKWYFEFVDVQNYTVVGMQEINPSVRKWNTNGYPVTQSGISQFFVFLHQGDVNINNSNTSSAFTTFSDGDIGGIAIDLDNGAFYLHNAGTYVNSGDPTSGSSKTGSLGNITTGTEYIPITCNHSYGSDTRMYFNFGQDSTFQGYTTAGGNADANGFGDFKYAPPSGYLALCSANLPVSADIDPAQTDDDFPQKNFNVVTFSGNGSTNAVTGLGFKPDFIWGFTRDGNQSKRMIDSTRGGSSSIFSDSTAAASTSNTVISEFGSDGFTANGGYFNNDSGKECGAWCWRANGGTTSSNSSGSITSTVQTNPAQNFSIATYTGSGSAGATIGHGLSAKPAFILIKNTSDVDYWAVYHESIGADFYTSLTASVFSNNATFWNDTEPTSSVITLGTNNRVNGSSNSHVCYAWSQVEGYMKFSTYTGNGNADGPFVYTGFRPRMLFIKRNANSHNWITFDTATVTFNPVNEYANWDTGNASAQSASDKIDVLSTGFKLRSTGSSFNNSGSEYVYGAWGDVPFKYNNTF